MTLNLKVPKIACAACVDTVTSAVQTIDPAAEVQADTTKMVKVQSQQSEAAIKQADRGGWLSCRLNDDTSQ